MASTYSNLKIQLMTTGENTSTWGNVTNVNLGTAIEEAITGSVDVPFSSANVTLTLSDTNASQSARNLRLNCTGTATAGYNLVVPAIEKVYIVKNGTDGIITIKNAATAGIAVPVGKTTWVFNDGTTVVDVITTLASLTLTTALPVASGGTGTSTALTIGSVVFAGASGVYAQDNANLFWDDTNNRLGVGTALPGYSIDVLGSDTTAGLGYAARIRANATAAAGTIQFSDSGATAEWGYLAVAATTATLSSSATGSVLIRAGAATRFQFGSSGQLGIGGATYGSSGQVLTSGGASAAPTWSTLTTGSVTSVSGTGTVNGISLSGTVTSSGSLTLGGALSGVSLTTQVTGTLPIANGGTAGTTAATARAALGKLAYVASGTGTNTGSISWGTGAVPASLDEGAIYLRYT